MEQCAEADQGQYGRRPKETNHHKVVEVVDAREATTSSINLLVGKPDRAHNREPQASSKSKNLEHNSPLIYQ